jgi:hypothetical protein
MIKNKQLISDNKRGDCMRACLTSILELPNTNKLPNFTVGKGYMKWRKLLETMGMSINYDERSFWRSGYWIGSVKSKNYKDIYHAIVMYGVKVAHDPSTKKRYKTGRFMLGGKNIIRGGYWLEIIDPHLLPKLEELKKKLWKMK